MSHQRERGFLPALRPTERLHNLVKSAPNLDNKSRSSTSTSTDNILGNSVDHCDNDRLLAASTTSNDNSHHYTNTNYHSIYYERDLKKHRHDNELKPSDSTASINSHHDQSNESYDYESDNSEHAPSIGCFSFAGNSSTNDSKKSKNRYKKLPKVPTDLENRQLLLTFDKKLGKSANNGSRKNSADAKKKIQFAEVSSPKARFDFGSMFYKRFEQSLDMVGSHELDEEDCIYIRTKITKNKLSMRLQQSLDAIDIYEVDDTDRSEKIYSKSIDDLSHRGESQFTWECFLKNGRPINNGTRVHDSDSSSQESGP